LVYESIILKFILSFYEVLKKYSANSFIISGFERLYHTVIKLLASSSILNFIRREGFLARTWENSGVYRLIKAVMEKPSTSLRKLYVKGEQIFAASLTIKLLKAVLNRFHLILGAFLFVLLVVPHQYWNNMYSAVAAGGLFLLFFIKTVIFKGTGFRTKSLGFYLFVFILSILIAQVFSIFPQYSLRFLAFYITCFLFLLLIVSEFGTIDKLETLLGILLVAVTITGLYGIWQRIVGVPVNAAYVDLNLNEGLPGRVYSTMGNPNNYAEILVLLIPFYFAAIFNSKTTGKKLLYTALAVPPMISLLLTGSRSSWIGFAAAFMVYLFFKNKKLIPVVIVLGLMSVPFLPQSIYRRILTIFNPNDSSMGYRRQIYLSVIPMFRDFWPTGFGLGTDIFRKLANTYHWYTGSVPAHSHNFYLQLWLETGIIGIISFLGVILRIVKRSIKTIYSNADEKAKNILMSGIMSITSVLVVGIVEYVWFYQRVMLIFWVVVGVMLATLAICTKREDYLIKK